MSQGKKERKRMTSTINIIEEKSHVPLLLTNYLMGEREGAGIPEKKMSLLLLLFNCLNCLKSWSPAPCRI